MDLRLGITGIILFLVAYAQTTPLFYFFSIKPDIVLAFAIVLAFSCRSSYQCIFFVVMGSLGLAFGIGLLESLFFFSAIFVLTQGVRLALPWQPFVSGFVLVLFFTFLTYIPLNWDIFTRLAPQFAREAFCNVALFMAFHTLLLLRYERQGRY